MIFSISLPRIVCGNLFLGLNRQNNKIVIKLRFYMEGIGVVVYTAAENKTRTHASRELFLANYIYTPDPWEGSIGVARSESNYPKNKKAGI